MRGNIDATNMQRNECELHQESVDWGYDAALNLFESIACGSGTCV